MSLEAISQTQTWIGNNFRAICQSSVGFKCSTDMLKKLYKYIKGEIDKNQAAFSMNKWQYFPIITKYKSTNCKFQF